MKTIRIFISVMMATFVTSCALDNYDMPSSSLSGRFIDNLTGESIQCDIYNGTTIQYIEDGYTQIQSNVVKADGSYSIGQMFPGKYSIIPIYTNFEKVDTLKMDIEGKMTYDFVVEPYNRITNVTSLKSGLTKITATFTVEQANMDYGVMKVGMFLYKQPTAGAYMYFEARETIVGGQTIGTKTYTMTIDYKESTKLKSGETYYVRVGALSSASNARYNYAPAVAVEI